MLTKLPSEKPEMALMLLLTAAFKVLLICFGKLGLFGVMLTLKPSGTIFLTGR